MKTSTVFKNGRSTQAVRIPASYRLPTEEVWIEQVGNSLVITPKFPSWDDFFASSLKISEDFSMERNADRLQERKEWE